MKEYDPTRLNRELDAINYEAQRAIMDKSLSEFRKDHIVEKTVDKIWKIAEERKEYKAK